MTEPLVLPLALVVGTLILVVLRLRSLRHVAAAPIAPDAPLTPSEILRLRRWRRRFRRTLWLVSIGYLTILLAWAVLPHDQARPRLALALLAVILAFGTAVQFSVRCPRCGFNLGFQLHLPLSADCERCGGKCP